MEQQHLAYQRRWSQCTSRRLTTAAFSFRTPRKKPTQVVPALHVITPDRTVPTEPSGSYLPTKPPAIPSAHRAVSETSTKVDPVYLSPSELQLILQRRLQNLNLPETPHLLLAERFSTTITTLTSFFCKLHLLQTPQVRALRTNNHLLFSRLRLLSLLNLPAPRLLLYPLLRHLPALHWLLAPFRAMALPFLLDGLARLAVHMTRRALMPRPIPKPDLYADLSSLREHFAEKLRNSHSHVEEMISKAGAGMAQLRHDIELKLPPALSLPPSEMLFTPREKTVTLRMPRARSFVTPVKGVAFRKEGSDSRKGLQTLSEDTIFESPSLTLLPRSIARPLDS